MKPVIAAAPPMAQINVRISRSLKDAGDAVLAEQGISPSQIVRDLWTRLAERGDVAQQVLEDLRPSGRTAEQQAEIDRKLAIIDRMTTRFESFGQSMGVDMSNLPMYDEDFDWREAMWEERDERAAERGLL